MTDLEKAEIVLSVFRGERECVFCHRFFPPDEMMRWQHMAAGRGPGVCYYCWIASAMPNRPIIRTDIS